MVLHFFPVFFRVGLFVFDANFIVLKKPTSSCLLLVHCILFVAQFYNAEDCPGKLSNFLSNSYGIIWKHNFC